MLMLLQNSEFVMEEETSKAEAPGARERPRAARSPVAAARLCLARVVSLAVNRVCPLASLQGCTVCEPKSVGVTRFAKKKAGPVFSHSLSSKWETVGC